ncbi:MAG: TetR/AcrR family transcriptional regulator [Mariprofundaceae bacterium]
MARRSDHSRKELREMAIKVAEKMIDTEGLKGLSARKVASEMGYAVGTLYLVFKNLDELIMAVHVKTLEQLADQIDSITGDKPAKTIEKIAKRYIHYAVSNTPRWLAVFEHHLPEGESVSESYKNVVIRLFKSIEKPLALLRPTNNDEAIKIEARALWASVHGLCVLSAGDKLNRIRSVDSEAVVDVLLQRYIGNAGGQF